MRESKRADLQLFAANRRVFKAYVLREQLDRLWTYKTRPGVFEFPARVDQSAALATPARNGAPQGLPVQAHRGYRGVLRSPRRFGVVESINTTIKAVLPRARAMRDEEMLLLKLKWATAHPIRSALDLVPFLAV